ncbi:MAG: GtrA family protein [Pseudomonadota bacterium]
MWSQLSRFLQVGALGFAIDAGVLWLCVYQLDMPYIGARLVSFIATIAVTFVLNARYTFAVPVRGASKTRYAAIQIAGAVLNFTSYSWLVLSGPLAGRPLLCLVVGSALAAVHNFVMMRRFVFHDQRVCQLD